MQRRLPSINLLSRKAPHQNTTDNGQSYWTIKTQKPVLHFVKLCRLEESEHEKRELSDRLNLIEDQLQEEINKRLKVGLE